MRSSPGRRLLRGGGVRFWVRLSLLSPANEPVDSPHLCEGGKGPHSVTISVETNRFL